MRFDLAMFGLAVASVCCAACGGGSGPVACPMLCGPVRTVAYFSVTDPTSGGAVAGVTFSEGSFELPATRVSRIDFGPSPGPCDCYEVDVRAESRRQCQTAVVEVFLAEAAWKTPVVVGKSVELVVPTT